MASKGSMVKHSRDSSMDFLKNLKLENKSKAYNSSSNKSSFVGDGKDSKVG